MIITVLQRKFLEKIWKEQETIDIQIIKDIVGKGGKRTNEMLDLNKPEILITKKILTPTLLKHLQIVRISSRIKNEGSELKYCNDRPRANGF